MGPELAGEPPPKKKKSDGPKKSYRGPREVFGPTKNRLGGKLGGVPNLKKLA